MRTYTKLILTTLTATAILALAIDGATARSLSTNERDFELIWNNALTGKASSLPLPGRGSNATSPS